MSDVVEIDLNYGYRQESATCCICGQATDYSWGVPICVDTALIVANDYQGNTGGMSCCQRCYHRHEAGEFVGTYPKH